MARPPKSSPPSAVGETSGTNRLSIPLNSSGGIDWDGMRSSTRDRLLSITGEDATILESIGMAGWVKGNLEASESDSGLPALTEENVKTAIDLVSQSSALLFRIGIARFVKHPLKVTPDGKPVRFVIDMDILTKAFTMTAAQHEELDPRALRLANKYTSELPDWVKKNFDVYVLAAMYLKFTADNARTAMELQIQRDIGAAKAKVHVASSPPVDSDAAPHNGAAGAASFNHEKWADRQPGTSVPLEPESFEPGSDAAIAP